MTKVKLNHIDLGGDQCQLPVDTNLYILVQELPERGKKDKIYLVKDDTAPEGNVYNEYSFVNGAWESLGQHSSSIDVEIPTKLSQLENDSGFVERENYTSGDYQISKGIVLYENEDEQEVITKTKGMNRVSLHINPLAEFGTSSKCGIQLIFKDLSGNEFLRFPNEDGWIEDKAELVDCIISDTMGNYIEMYGEAKSYGFYDSLPSEFKLYVQSHFGGERYFNLTCDVNGSMSIDTKFKQKQDTLKSGVNIKTIDDQSILGTGDIQIAGVLKGQQNHYISNCSNYALKLSLDPNKRKLVKIESYFKLVNIFLTDDQSLDTHIDIGNNSGHPGSFFRVLLFEPCLREEMKLTIFSPLGGESIVQLIDPNVNNILTIETIEDDINDSLDATVIQYH